MRWPWQRNGHEAKRVHDEAKRERVREQRNTPVVGRLAPDIADLPEDEFADRLRRALKVRHT
jgi:hypothetical protein